MERKPLWVDATMEAKLYEELLGGEFFPAKRNVLLVGDAAGFQLPTGEGIGTAMKSGVCAARSIAEASKGYESAEDIYRNKVIGIIGFIRALYDMALKSRFKTDATPQQTVSGIKEMMVRSFEPIG